MGCSSSTPGGKAPIQLSKPDALFLQALQKSKLASFSNGHRVTFSGLLIKFGRMKQGFLRLEYLFDHLKLKTVTAQKKGSGTIDMEQFKGRLAELPCSPDSTSMGKVLEAYQAKSFIDSDDLLMIFCILFMLDGPEGITEPEIAQSLTIIEQAFSCFDVSSDGTLQREELIAALENNGGSSVNLKATKSQKGRAGAKKNPRLTGPASLLFDALDLDNSGEITFKEFLLGLRQIVMESFEKESFNQPQEEEEAKGEETEQAAEETDPNKA